MADNEEVKTWSDNVADLVTDALVDNGLVKKEDFQKVSAIAAEEILVRLLLNNFPPLLSAKS